MENVLVTGLTGRSGQYFGELLARNGHQNIIAMIRNEKKFRELFGVQTNLSCEICDIADVDGIREILERHQVKTVFHIINIRYSIGIVKAALAAKCVDRLIFVHTTGIYSKFKAAGAEYLEIEAEIDRLLKGSGIALTILRPTMIYGSLDDANVSVFIRMVDKLRLFPLVKGGRYELQPVNQRDLGKAYYQVLMNEKTARNKNYTLSGGRVIYLRDMLERISVLLGKKTIFFPVPFWLAYSGAWALYLLSFTKFDLREKVQRLVEPRAYGHEEAAADFGYEPMDFWDGLEQEVRLYQNSRT